MPEVPTIYYNVILTPCGRMFIADRGGELCLCDWHMPTDAIESTSALLDEARRQIGEYFEGKLKHFRLPLRIEGTPFRLSVWAALAAIPYGATISYGELAAAIGRPDAVRAVAGACGANKLSLLIPCHRVVGYNGRLTGYAGGLPAKETLLTLERHYSGI